MPSPLLHSAAGLAIYGIDRTALISRRRALALILIASLIPDADFMFGIVLADPNRFHAGFTHSLGAAAVAGFVFGLLSGRQHLRVGFLCALAFASHVILDSLTLDGRPPLGVPILWPLRGNYFNYPVIDGITHGMGGVSTSEFFRHVFSLDNLRTIAVESALGAIMILVSVLVERMRSTGASRLT